jgi:hypothetical protein
LREKERETERGRPQIWKKNGIKGEEIERDNCVTLLENSLGLPSCPYEKNYIKMEVKYRL